MKRKKKRPTFWLWVAGGIVVAFALWNLLWFLLFFRPYTQLIQEDYTKTTWNSSFVVRHSADDSEEWFTCSVKAPDYLSTTGNLSIVSRYGTHDLLIWLNPISGNIRYGVSVGLNTTVTEGDAVPSNPTGYSFYIDEDLVPEEDSYLPIVEEYRTDIEELFAVAEAEWGIGATG